MLKIILLGYLIWQPLVSGAEPLTMLTRGQVQACFRHDWTGVNVLEFYRACYHLPNITLEQIHEIDLIYADKHPSHLLALCEEVIEPKLNSEAPAVTVARLGVYIDDIGRFEIDDFVPEFKVSRFYESRINAPSVRASCQGTGSCTTDQDIVKIREYLTGPPEPQNFADYDLSRQTLHVWSHRRDFIFYHTVYDFKMKCQRVVGAGPANYR